MLLAGGARYLPISQPDLCEVKEVLKKLQPRLIQNKSFVIFWTAITAQPFEFDFFLFGVEGYSRVTETQLVRKRIASYLIKVGTCRTWWQRAFNVVYPQNAAHFGAKVTLPDGHGEAFLNGRDLAELTRQWYEAGIDKRPAGRGFTLLEASGHRIQGNYRHERSCPV